MPRSFEFILVTGASRGLGMAIANHLISLGENLVLVARDIQALEATRRGVQLAPGQQVECIRCDFADKFDLDDLVRRLSQFQFKGVVNNAGIQGPIGCLQDNDWCQWMDTLEVNLIAPIYLYRALVPLIMTNGIPGGSIINLSGGGATSPRPKFSAYAVSKAALVAFSATLAEELRDKNIRVNAIAPGPLPTSMLKQVLHSGIDKAGKNEVASAERVLGRSDDAFLQAVKLCEFLLHDRSRHVTGKLLSAVWDNWDELDKIPLEVLTSDIFTLRRVLDRDRQDLLRVHGLRPLTRVN